MFYLRERNAGMGSPAITLYKDIQHGEYKNPKILYLSQIERITPLLLGDVLYEKP